MEQPHNEYTAYGRITEKHRRGTGTILRRNTANTLFGERGGAIVNAGYTRQCRKQGPTARPGRALGQQQSNGASRRCGRQRGKACESRTGAAQRIQGAEMTTGQGITNRRAAELGEGWLGEAARRRGGVIRTELARCSLSDGSTQNAGSRPAGRQAGRPGPPPPAPLPRLPSPPWPALGGRAAVPHRSPPPAPAPGACSGRSVRERAHRRLQVAQQGMPQGMTSCLHHGRLPVWKRLG